MTTQNVLQKAMDMLGKNMAGSTSRSKNEGKDSTGFGQIFSNQITENKKFAESAPKQDLKTDRSEGEWTKKSDAAQEKTEEEPIQVAEPEKGLEEPEETVSENDISQNNTEDMTLETMNTLNMQIIDVVTQMLGISEEQLADTLDSMGLSVQDLLQPENVKALFMQVQQIEDPMALLTDEDLTKQLQALLNAVEQSELSTNVLPSGDNLDVTAETPQTEEEGKFSEAQLSATDGDETAGNQGKVKESSISVQVTKESSGKEMNAQEFGRDQHSGKNPESQNENPMNAFIQNLAGADTQNTLASAENQTSRFQVMQNIVEQVVEQIKVNLHPDTTSMELMLNPESLGKVILSVASSKDGQLTASFTAQNEMAKAALEGQMQILKDNLNEQGMKVNAIEVTVSNFGQEFSQGGNLTGNGNGQQPEQKARRRVLNLSEFNEGAEDVTEEEALAARVLEQQGGSVEYTA